MPEFVGTITGSTAPYTSKVYGGTTYKYDAVTDANGMATVTVNSTVKGDQYIYAVADYPGNPQSSGQSSIPAISGDLPLNWSQLRFATAEKVWLANATGAATYKVFGMHGEDESAGTIIDGNSYTNPILPFAGYTVTGSATVTIAPPAAGTLATGHATVAAGAVTGILVDTAGTGYTAADIGRALTIGPPIAVGSGATATATLGTAPSTGNTVGLISVTAGGTGYATAPTVNISAPNITGGTQATATATLGGTSVVSVTIATAGSGYTSAPTVTFYTGTQAAATITTLAANGVATVTVTVPGTGYPTAPIVTFPLPLKVQATATATIAGGVVTALTFVAPGFAGSGYITAPVVTISGTGTGAAAHATVNADSTITLVLTAGGSFTGGTTTEPTSANLNRETLGVQVVDQFGNALADYKVKCEIVQQGTSTSGTVPTYHPYAHFEDAEHSMSEEPNETTLDHESFVNDVAGIGDINSHVDINPIWNYGG